MAAPSRRWGWHQLTASWAQQLVADARIRPGDLVLDVGAGAGALTRPLLEAGARVIAVEAHPGRAAELRRRFGCEVVVVQADAADLRLPRRPYRVVANPPFAITTPLLRRLLQPGSRLLDAHLVVQEQAAHKWASRAAPAASRWQRTHRPSLGRRVPRNAFRPPPRVDTRILRIERATGS